MKLVFYTYSYTDRLQLLVADCLARIARVDYASIDESGTFGASEDPHSVTSERRRLVADTTRQRGLSVEAVVTHAERSQTQICPMASPTSKVRLTWSSFRWFRAPDKIGWTASRNNVDSLHALWYDSA